MKRVASIVLCVILALSITACGKKEEKKPTEQKKHSVDVEALVNEGKIDTIECKLGDDVSKTKEMLKNMKNDHDESTYNERWSKDQKYIIMSAESIICRYPITDDISTVSYIAVSEGAYGFDTGESTKTVIDAMKTLGHTATERDAAEDELFFLPRGTAATVLEYKFEENTLMFVFVDSGLSFTAIYK